MLAGSRMLRRDHGMTHRTLQEFVAELDRLGELKRVSYPADPYLEITEIADRVMKSGGPALLFERPRGHEIPLLINAFGSRRRMNAALGVDDLETLAAEIEDLTRLDLPAAWGDRVRLLPRLGRLARSGPRRVKTGVCKEVIHHDDASLALLPVQ